jgi:hypothetical protein
LEVSEVESQATQHRLRGTAGAEDRQENVLRTDGLVAQAVGFLPRLDQGLLRRGAEGARGDSGCGVGAQSGLASSMSMMGMPSSTA